jgi:hypothetical protein
MTFDEVRIRYPKLGFALYAYEPGDPITLEVHAAYNETFIWTGPTLASVLEQAFKPVVSTAPPGAVAAVSALPPPHDLREAGGVAETTGGVFD